MPWEMSCEAAESPARPEPTTIACLLVDFWFGTLDMVDSRCLRIMDVMTARTEKRRVFRSVLGVMVFS